MDARTENPVKSLEDSIREFIVREFLQGADSSELTHATQLVEGGIVDSINVLMLVDFLEEGHDFEIEPEDVREFLTIDKIARIVRLRTGVEA